MALLEHRRHQHDVVAVTLCRVYILDSEALAQLARHHPEIVKHIKEVAKERELENKLAKRPLRAKTAAAKKVGETEKQ
jgi:CRP-like cAMP-binding protein